MITGAKVNNDLVILSMICRMGIDRNIRTDVKPHSTDSLAGISELGMPAMVPVWNPVERRWLVRTDRSTINVKLLRRGSVTGC